jgi:hypothetical protein
MELWPALRPDDVEPPSDPPMELWPALRRDEVADEVPPSDPWRVPELPPLAPVPRDEVEDDDVPPADPWPMLVADWPALRPDDV